MIVLFIHTKVSSKSAEPPSSPGPSAPPRRRPRWYQMTAGGGDREGWRRPETFLTLQLMIRSAGAGGRGCGTRTHLPGRCCCGLGLATDCPNYCRPPAGARRANPSPYLLPVPTPLRILYLIWSLFFIALLG